MYMQWVLDFVKVSLVSLYTCMSIKYTATNYLAIAYIWSLTGEIPTGPQRSQRVMSMIYRLIRGAGRGGLAMYGHSGLEIWQMNRGGIFLLAP